MTTPCIKNNYQDEIIVEINGSKVRSWTYADETEKRIKMRMAREFAEGCYQRGLITDRGPDAGNKASAASDLADNAPRAIEMLRVAAAFIREHDPDGIAHYDEAVCDGYCIADDCESAADILQGAITKAKGGDA